MKVLVNGKICSETALLQVNNRAFQFGDGLFETMLFNNSAIRFFDDHYKRLKNGMEAIGLSTTNLNQKVLHDEVVNLCSVNGLSKCRVKIIVCRQSGTSVGYNVDTDQFDYLVLTATTNAPLVKDHGVLSICEKVQLNNSITSKHKTLSALPYVIAAQEKKQKQKDDLVLTDNLQNVSECTSSNIFWIGENQLFTPPLDTGCISGVMRTQIMREFDVLEVRISYRELMEKRTIFSTNVAQLSLYTAIDDQPLEMDHPIINQIKQLWEL